MTTSTVWAFTRLSRPHFLAGGWLLFAVGAASAPSIDVTGYLVAQFMVTAAQVTAHYVNEYSDLDADAGVVNRTLFSGGSGVFAEGLLSPVVGLRAAAVSSVLAAGAAVVVMSFSIAAGLIGLVAVIVSWAYSAPPTRLLASGFGELAATLVVAGAVPLVGSLAQGANPSTALCWAIAVLIPIHSAMMLSFEIPDAATDTAAGKRVLAVRLGSRRTVRTITGSLLLAGVTIVVAGLIGGLPAPAAGAALLGVVPGAVVVFAAGRNRYQLLTGSAVATLLVVTTGLLVGLVV